MQSSVAHVLHFLAASTVARYEPRQMEERKKEQNVFSLESFMVAIKELYFLIIVVGTVDFTVRHLFLDEAVFKSRPKIL